MASAVERAFSYFLAACHVARYLGLPRAIMRDLAEMRDAVSARMSERSVAAPGGHFENIPGDDKWDWRQ